MYAVVATGGKQYRVKHGSVLRIEAIDGDIGSEINFNNVLMFSDEDSIKIGNPVVQGVTVSGRIIDQAKNKKILVFKYKRRKRYRRKYGHRQRYTLVMINKVEKF